MPGQPTGGGAWTDHGDTVGNLQVILLGLAAIAGFGLVLRRFARLPAAVCLPIAVAFVVTFAYAGALASQLRPASQILLAAGLACFAFEIIVAVARRSSPLFRPEIAIPLMLCVAMVWRLHDATFVAWDDFSHWALASREMLARHRLPDAATILQMPWYPPAINLFHYVTLGAAAAPEGDIIAAHCAMLILPLACLFHGLRWQQWHVALALVAGLYFALTVLGLGFQTAMSDHVISVFAAAALICWLILRRCGRNPAWVLPLLLVLVLIKEFGAFFAAVLGLMMAVDFALRRHEHRQTILLPTALVAAAMMVAPLAAMATWGAHLKANGIAADRSNLSLAKLQQEWSSSGTETSKAVHSNFLNAFWQRPLSQIEPRDIIAGRVPLAGSVVRAYEAGSWVVVLALMIAVPLLLGTDLVSRRRVAALAAIGALGLALYAVSLLAAYTLVFSSYEALRLASLERYLNSYFAMALLVALFLLSVTRMPRGLPRGAFAVAAVLFLFIFQTPSFAILLGSQVDPYRKEIAPLLAQVTAIVAPDKRVATIHQDSQGTEVVRVRFDLQPRKLSSHWSLGRPYYLGDIWTSDLTRHEFATLLSRSDYLFLSRADTQFWDTYGGLFAPEDRFSDTYLYRIEKPAEGIRLVAEIDRDGRKLADPRSKRVTITDRPRLLDDIEVTPLNDEWPQVFPPARLRNEGFKITEPTSASYYAISKVYHLPKGTLVAADVTVRRGGLVLGLFDWRGQWAHRLVLPSGHFLAVIEVEQAGEHRVVLAPSSTAGEATDIDVSRVGLLGGARPHDLDPSRRIVAPNANILRQHPTIEPLRRPDWLTILPPAVLDGNSISLRGPPQAFYAVRSHLYRLRKGALVAARGVVNDGSLILGLLNAREEWVYEAVASIPPGPFFAAVEIPAEGDYRVVLGHSGTSQQFDAEVTEIGFLGGLQPSQVAD
jgi:hypothetical protein